MAEYKILSARCTKYNKRFCIEVKKNTEFEVVNFLQISNREAAGIPFSYLATDLKTASSLLPCYRCGNRKVGACSCASRHERCTPGDLYHYQCIYCDKLRLDPPPKKDLKIYVSTPHYDNIGAVLDSMHIKYQAYREDLNCDLLFINCGTEDCFDPTKLALFVERGGCVYISDLAFDRLCAAFPGVIFADCEGDECSLWADVEDEELRQIIGNKIEVEFDLGSWAIITDISGLSRKNGKVLLRASKGTDYQGAPLMVSFRHGEGTVFYTSFHNHAQASEKEKMLLQLLLMKQIGANTNQTVEQVSSTYGLNLASMKNIFRT